MCIILNCMYICMISPIKKENVLTLLTEVCVGGRVHFITFQTFQFQHPSWTRYSARHSHVQIKMLFIAALAFQLDAKQFTFPKHILHGILPQFVPLCLARKPLWRGGRGGFNEKLTPTSGANQRQQQLPKMFDLYQFRHDRIEECNGEQVHFDPGAGAGSGSTTRQGLCVCAATGDPCSLTTAAGRGAYRHK